jgi:hypothetical protein
MSRYEVIRDIDRSLSALLEKHLRPVDGKKPRVALSPPKRDSFESRDLPAVDLYLYDLQEDGDLRHANKVLVTEKDPRGLTVNFYVNPPLYLRLAYVLTAWGADAAQEHALLGQAMRILEDHKPLEGEDEVIGESFLPDEVVRFELMRELDLEYKTRMWSAFGETLRPSAIYLVRARIDSDLKTGPVTRVEERVTGFKQRKSRTS